MDFGEEKLPVVDLGCETRAYECQMLLDPGTLNGVEWGRRTNSQRGLNFGEFYFVRTRRIGRVFDFKTEALLECLYKIGYGVRRTRRYGNV